MIKTFGSPGKVEYELEQIKDLLNFDDSMVLIDGQQAHSYNELVQICSDEKHKNRQSIEIVLLPAITGG